jgi:WD40 repeat protein
MNALFASGKSFRARQPGRSVSGLVLLAALSGGLAAVPARVTPPGPAEIRRLIVQLGSRRYADREAAGKRLLAIGEPAWYPLHRAATQSEDLETRRRAGQLARAVGKRLFVEVRHFGGPIGGYWLNRVAFTPDGRHALATGGGVILYDLSTGKEVYRTLELQFARAGLALSRDGRLFLTGHQHDAVVRLGEVATGKEVRRFEGHKGGVWGVALSTDAARAASGGDDGAVLVWDVKAGRELRRCLAGAGQVRCVAFAPDGRHVLSGHFGPGSQNVVCLWNAESGQEVRRFRGHNGDVTAVAFLPDGRDFLSASTDGTVRLWDVGAGKELRRMQHPGGVYDAKVSADGRRALSAGFGDRTVRLWDLTDGTELHRFEGHAGAVLGVAFSADGRRALSSDAQYTVRLWRLPAPQEK